MVVEKICDRIIKFKIEFQCSLLASSRKLPVKVEE